MTDNNHNLTESDIATLETLFKKHSGPEVLQDFENSSLFSISMTNYYLSVWGEIYKTQVLKGNYERLAQEALSEYALSLLYTWNELKFSSTSAKKTVDKLPWTFAEGSRFEYYKYFPQGCPDIVPKGDSETVHNALLGLWYPHLPSTSSVNLLTLLTWDVVTFEDIANAIVFKDFHECGKEVEIDHISNTNAQLNFQGCDENHSFFENGKMLARLLGYCESQGRCAEIYEFQCIGKLNVRAPVENTDDHVDQKGESFYFGKLYIDVRNRDLLFGNFVENLTVSITNNKGKVIPSQKRRVVELKKIL